MKKWKKYGAVALSLAVLTGVCAESGVLRALKEVSAQETEETQRVTLNIVTDDDDQTDEEKSAAAEKTSGAEETLVEEDASGTGETQADEVSMDENEDSTEAAAETSSKTEETQSEESERVTLNRGGSASSDDDVEASADAGDSDAEAETASSSDAEAEEDHTEEEAAENAEEAAENAAEDAEDSEDIQLSTASEDDTTVSGIVTTDVSAIVEQCMSSIVTITCVSEETVSVDEDSDYFYYYSDEEVTEEVETAATGIIIAKSDSELLIATNYHVVSDAESVMVSFTVEAEDENDLTVSAKIKGTSSSADLAVVAVELSDIEDSVLDQLSVATLGSSEDLKIGQAAISISNALGYGQSVTVGVISALDREVEVDGVTMEVIVTDAAANLGSSGGALLNASGEVIGIGVAKESGDGAEGMAYAIPIDDAIPVLEQLINKETRDKLSDSERGYIGATVLTVSDEAVETYNMPAGAFVYEVTEGSAADEAGIMSGDIISGIEGESVTSSTELIEKMSYYAPGETITLEVQTANNGVYEARDVEVTLQAGSSSEADDSEEEDQEDSQEGAIPDENENQNGEGEIGTLPYDDSEDDFEEDFGEGFDDGFEDGFEDYNSQFD
ncbi:MAG: S1C family serine protease [Lachnospiraceae bacterium]|nr:S1C family serine protease [Lachnospiraceae bacterium]